MEEDKLMRAWTLDSLRTAVGLEQAALVFLYNHRRTIQDGDPEDIVRALVDEALVRSDARFASQLVGAIGRLLCDFAAHLRTLNLEEC